MAEFLIKAQNATHPDATKDARGCYKRGDIVHVAPDGHAWGALERLPRFVVVKVPGVDHVRAAKYVEETSTTRRKFRIRVDDVSLALRNQLRDNGEITVTWTQVRGFLRDKIANVDETNKPVP